MNLDEITLLASQLYHSYAMAQVYPALALIM
jgi:hypothetical protein